MENKTNEKPIIVKNGKVINYNKDLEQKVKEQLIYISKITKGLYTGIMIEDKDYIEFCDKSIKKLIDEKTFETIITKVDVKSVNVQDNKEKKTNSICYNKKLDRIIKIDLDKDLTKEEKDEAIDRIVEDQGTTNTKDCGRTLTAQLIKMNGKMKNKKKKISKKKTNKKKEKNNG